MRLLFLFVLAACSDRGLEAEQAFFNADTSSPRMIVFFSSGCPACDTGSAALQQTLATLPGPLAVIAVWEPIFADDPPPSRRMLANLSDPRVHQLWDPSHRMSAALRAAELAHPGSPTQARTRTNDDPEGIMYDTVVIFGPGVRWGATLPPPDHLDIGLAASLPTVREQLAAFRPTSGSPGRDRSSTGSL